jgi:hypothetical protein
MNWRCEMAVKKLNGATRAKKAGQALRKVTRKGKAPQDLTELGFPTKRNKPVLDLRRYAVLVFGREGVGKTTWLASFPEMLFITAEAGAKGLDIFEWNAEHGGTTSWEIFLKCIELFETMGKQAPFKNIAIDTIDRLFDLCRDYIVRQLGIPDIGFDKDGKKDRGHSFIKMNEEMTNALDRLKRCGIGIYLVSHMKEIEIERRNGTSYNRIVPSMSDSPRRVVEASSDFILFFDYAKDANDNDVRIIITSGSDEIVAKSRKVAGHSLPKYLELTEDDGYELFKSAFLGEYRGLDPRTLLPSNRTSAGGAAVMSEDRVKSKLKPRKKVGGKGGARRA